MFDNNSFSKKILTLIPPVQWDIFSCSQIFSYICSHIFSYICSQIFSYICSHIFSYICSHIFSRLCESRISTCIYPPLVYPPAHVALHCAHEYLQAQLLLSNCSTLFLEITCRQAVFLDIKILFLNQFAATQFIYYFYEIFAVYS